jgi:hypothetical protein
VEHFVYNLKDNTLLSSAALPGALMKTNEGDSMEQILRHYDQKQSANQTTRADLLPINDLLSAAGISLNSKLFQLCIITMLGIVKSWMLTKCPQICTFRRQSHQWPSAFC